MDIANYPADGRLDLAAAQLGSDSKAPRRDLTALREVLATHVGFARDLGFRAHGVADAIMGNVPTNIANGAGRPDGPPPSIGELIDQLGVCLREISDGLNRV